MLPQGPRAAWGLVDPVLGLALTGLALGALPGARGLHCPTSSAVTSSSINTVGAASYFSLRPVFATASSSSNCISRAQSANCAGGRAAFFIYAALGLLDETGTALLGNCAYGAACAAPLNAGSKAATYGLVPPANCPPSPPSLAVACPTATTPYSGNLDVSDIASSFVDFNPNFAWVNNANDCRALAMKDRCLGRNTTSYIFSAQDYLDQYGRGMGNCAYGSGCRKLSGGTISATAGAVPMAQCAPPPPPSTTVACPSETTVLNLDTSSLYSLQPFRGNTGQLTQAANASDCIQQAKQYQCQGKQVHFYLYSRTGFYHPLGLYFGNCAYGPGCGTLKQGSVVATGGPVPNVQCPPSPPPPPPSVLLACPSNLTMRNVSLNPSNVFSYFQGGSASVLDVSGGAAGCRDQARADKCFGNPGSFFIFSAAGFNDPMNGQDYLGNCAFGSPCMSLRSGTRKAVVGLTSLCPGPPPPAKRPPPPYRKPIPPPPARRNPPPKSAQNICKGATLDASKCQCPSWARCQKRSICNGAFACRCLGERNLRVEFSNGTLRACIPWEGGSNYCANGDITPDGTCVQ